MIFVSAEQSQAAKTVELSYPNGYVMLFIPVLGGHQTPNDFVQRFFSIMKSISEKKKKPFYW